jgi:hypothetical protein
MLEKVFVASVLVLCFSFGSCHKDCEEPFESVCQLQPEYVVFCATGVEPKYYFDQEAGECTLYYPAHESIVPFQTKDECERCDCSNNLDEPN